MSTKSIKLWDSTFYPDSQSEDLVNMRFAYQNQLSALVANALKICFCQSPYKTLATIDDDLMSILEAQLDGVKVLAEDPVFAIWARFLHRAVQLSREEEVQYHCNNLSTIVARLKKRYLGKENLYIPKSTISLQQKDFDPYVMAAIPPSYDFRKDFCFSNSISFLGHPLLLQRELISIALNNIEQVWPEMKNQILEVVKIIGYLPDAKFRSCSAARYGGVVLLGNMDESILDIEESLVHEAGHQVLYRLSALMPLTQPGTPKDDFYTLPWSGSRRDLFGFLHAFYIYVLLTKYFLRRASLFREEEDECVQRARLIMIGNQLAIPMLKNNANLSELGKILFENISKDIENLISGTNFCINTGGKNAK